MVGIGPGMVSGDCRVHAGMMQVHAMVTSHAI